MKLQDAILLAAVAAVLSYVAFTHEGPAEQKPSCSDGIMNQDEAGVDCGGSCPPCATGKKPCTELEDSNSRSVCLFNEGVQKLNASICGLIESSVLKDDCFKAVAKELEDWQTCSNIENNLSMDECLRDVAINSMDAGVCVRVSDLSQRDTCFYRIAFDTPNMTICENIESNPSKNTCLGLLSRNSSFCDFIDDSNSRDWCYNKVASLNPEVKTCANIQSMQTKDLCYKVVAVKKINFELCSVLQNKTLQAQCLTEVEEAKKKMDELQSSLPGGTIVPA